MMDIIGLVISELFHKLMVVFILCNRNSVLWISWPLNYPMIYKLQHSWTSTNKNNFSIKDPRISISFSFNLSVKLNSEITCIMTTIINTK